MLGSCLYSQGMACPMTTRNDPIRTLFISGWVNAVPRDYFTGYYDNNIGWASVLRCEGLLAVFTMVWKERDSAQDPLSTRNVFKRACRCSKSTYQIKWGSLWVLMMLLEFCVWCLLSQDSWITAEPLFTRFIKACVPGEVGNKIRERSRL